MVLLKDNLKKQYKLYFSQKKALSVYKKVFLDNFPGEHIGELRQLHIEMLEVANAPSIEDAVDVLVDCDYFFDDDNPKELVYQLRSHFGIKDPFYEQELIATEKINRIIKQAIAKFSAQDTLKMLSSLEYVLCLNK